MKKAMATLAADGRLILEFGGDLAGACCVHEDSALRASLERLGVRTAFQGVHCHLTRQDFCYLDVCGNCFDCVACAIGAKNSPASGKEA